MRTKLNPLIESGENYHAYEVWRDLGYGRTFCETARQVGYTDATIGKWAKLFKWEERITEYGIETAKRKDTGAIIKTNDPIAQKVFDIMEKAESLIDSAFVKDRTKKLSPNKNLKIENIEDLTKLIAEYRHLLETYHRFIGTHMPAKKDKDRGTVIEEFNLFMGNLSQTERIHMMEKIKNGNATRGNEQSSREVQDGDFEQVPERGDENGPGREGVPGSPTSSGGGDQTSL